MNQQIRPDDIFNFTLRLVYHLHPEAVVKGADDKTYDMLQEIVGGDTCLVGSPQEMTQPAAEDRKAELAEYLQRNVGKIIERDKEIAKMILDALNR